MYSTKQIQSRNPEHPLKVSSFIYWIKCPEYDWETGRCGRGEVMVFEIKSQKMEVSENNRKLMLDGISEAGSVSFLLRLHGMLVSFAPGT